MGKPKKVGQCQLCSDPIYSFQAVGAVHAGCARLAKLPPAVNKVAKLPAQPEKLPPVITAEVLSNALAPIVGKTKPRG